MNTDLTRAQVRALLLVAAKSQAGAASRYAHLLAAAADPATPVAELTAIKDTAKADLERDGDRSQRDEATLVYHAAVAAAFVHHSALISGRPMRKQRDIYRQYADAYADRPLGVVFREAVARIDGDGAT
jgi:hypothetical protein